MNKTKQNPTSDFPMRINRFIAKCGIASRRKADALVEQGRVTINRSIAMLSDKVEEGDEVTVDNKKISLHPEHQYFLLNKPRETISAVSDDRGRKTVVDLIKTDAPIFPVGRLDFDVSGALLLTNDGELAHGLTHPSFEIEKTYHAVVKGLMDESSIHNICSGVEIEEYLCKARSGRIIKHLESTSIVELVMTEGRKREVKLLLKSQGHHVIALKRVAFAFLTVYDLEEGTYRNLTDDEVTNLRSLCTKK